VQDGGRVASIGADSLRRGVTLRTDQVGDAGVLTSPTQPDATDPFGTHLTKPRTPSPPATLIQIDGDDQRLMTGAPQLDGFTKLEESLPPTGGRKLLSGVGQALTAEETAAAEQSGKPARAQRSAITVTQIGKGYVIRIGLPEWYAKLGDDSQVQQV